MDDIFTFDVARLRDDTLTKINTHGKKCSLQMEKLWLRMFGENKDTVTERYQTVQKHITKMFDDMVEEEMENCEKYCETLENLIEESKTLRRELNMDIQLPSEIDIKGNNLRHQIRTVETSLQLYSALRTERLALLDQYKREEEKLCLKLGEISMYSSCIEVPSEEKLKEMKQRIATLNSEKIKRQKTYSTYVNEIKDILKDLEITHLSDSNLKNALQSSEDFVLSQGNIQELHDWKVNFVDQMEAEIKLINELKDKTMILWNRLDVSAEEREQILMAVTKPCGKTVRNLWTKELERCEKLKKANIKNVIMRCRGVIKGLWDSCHMDQEERDLFIDYYCDEYNEELLESHEKEEERLRKYYEETSEIYSLAEKWFQLWDKMLSLESNSTNAKRLNNRGGQLLKEEKERKKIQKELPQVENKLNKLVEKFEENHCKPFLYDGRPLMEIISLHWDERRNEKEKEKEFRKMQNLSKVATPLKTTNPRITPISSNRKRVRPLTPVENIIPKKTTAKRELVLTKSREPSRRRSRSQEPMTRYGSQRNLRSNSANSSVISYNGFQNYIENKSRLGVQGMPLRSSLSPTRFGLGNNGPKTNSILFKTPTSAVKSATKRTRLNPPSSSKIIRPMIN